MFDVWDFLRIEVKDQGELSPPGVVDKWCVWGWESVERECVGGGGGESESFWAWSGAGGLAAKD